MPWALGYFIDFDFACQYALEHKLCSEDDQPSEMALFSAALDNIRSQSGHNTETAPVTICWKGHESGTVLALHQMVPNSPDDFLITFRKAGGKQKLTNLALAIGIRERPRWYVDCAD
jgi:hypothetical protein